MPAYATGFTWNARAVPIPCAATPTAKPRACQSLIRNRFIKGVTVTAPMIPVIIAKTAVSAEIPPMASEMPRATGAVVDFGERNGRLGTCRFLTVFFGRAAVVRVFGRGARFAAGAQTRRVGYGQSG